MDTFTLHIKKTEKIKHLHLNAKHTKFMCVTLKEDNLFLILKNNQQLQEHAHENEMNLVEKEFIRIMPFKVYNIDFPFNDLTFYCLSQNRKHDILIHFEQEL